ncbi:MAG: hypothetical protein IPG45_24195 [Deltaproteobacteria bacterium]|nr:hypothetical protein [Deltaproteobacteria bacterium]
MAVLEQRARRVGGGDDLKRGSKRRRPGVGRARIVAGIERPGIEPSVEVGGVDDFGVEGCGVENFGVDGCSVDRFGVGERTITTRSCIGTGIGNGGVGFDLVGAALRPKQSGAANHGRPLLDH